MITAPLHFSTRCRGYICLEGLVFFFLSTFLSDCLAFISVHVPTNNNLHRRPPESSRTSMNRFEWKLYMQVWLDARNIPDLSQIVLGGEVPDVVVVDSSYTPHLHDFGSARFMYSKEGDDRIWKLDVRSVVGSHVDISDESGQDHAIASLGSVEWLMVAAGDWQTLSAENLVECAKSVGTKISFEISRKTGDGSLQNAIELGADAICIDPERSDEDLIHAVFRACRGRDMIGAAEVSQRSFVPLAAGENRFVSGVCSRKNSKGTVPAETICVDFLQKLLPEEGCWIGSSEDTMALVLSEAATSQFAPNRSFRVNAGPVLSCILLADHTTKFLCELETADQILVYNSKTDSSRAVAVGRLKQEIRPCFLAALNAADGTGTGKQGEIILQEADTVRLAQEGGSFVRATDLTSRDMPLMLRVMAP